MHKHTLLEYDTSKEIFLGLLCYELANLSSGIFHGGLYCIVDDYIIFITRTVISFTWTCYGSGPSAVCQTDLRNHSHWKCIGKYPLVRKKILICYSICLFESWKLQLLGMYHEDILHCTKSLIIASSDCFTLHKSSFPT